MLRLNAGQQILRGMCSYDRVAEEAERLKLELIKCRIQLREKTTVDSIVSERKMPIFVMSGCQPITCRHVIIALGPWITMSPLVSLCQSVRNIRIKKVVALMVQHELENLDCAIDLADDYAFLLPMGKRPMAFQFYFRSF